MDFTHFHTTHVLGGDFAISSDPNELLMTVLGSCISACVYDPQAKIGGMNHFILPTGGDAEATERQPRYGDVAMRSLVDELIAQGARRSRLQAKLYGGRVRDVRSGEAGSINAAFAKRFLISEGIDLVDASIGNDLARWIKFHPVSGRVWIKLGSEVVAPAAVSGRSERRA